MENSKTESAPTNIILSTLWTNKAREEGILCICKQSQLPPVIFDNTIHFVFWDDTKLPTRIRNSNSSVRESIRSYNIPNCQWSTPNNIPIKKYTSKQCVFSIFFYSGKITLLATADQEKDMALSKQKQYNVALYSIEYENNAFAWTKVPDSDVSLSKEAINPNNCIATQHENTVVVLSLPYPSSNINIHTYSEVDHWKQTSLGLSQSDMSYASNITLELQSCAILNDHVYYSLACGDKVRIYKTNVKQKDVNNIISELDQQISQCFLSAFSGHILTLCMYGKERMEVQTLEPSEQLKEKFTYWFLSSVKIVAIKPITIKDMAIIYHDSTLKQCYLQILKTSS